jgi:hypothetical protein
MLRKGPRISSQRLHVYPTRYGGQIQHKSPDQKLSLKGMMMRPAAPYRKRMTNEIMAPPRKTHAPTEWITSERR